MNDQGLNDFNLGNDFIPSNHDVAFAMWVFGSLAIYFWTRFFCIFLADGSDLGKVQLNYG